MKKTRKIVSIFLSILMIVCTSSVFSINVQAGTTLDPQKVVDTALSYVGGTYKANYCLAFVKDMFVKAYGLEDTACCAYTYGSRYIDSTNRNNIPKGADVFFSGSTLTCPTCGNKCGHIGIYVGDDYIVHAWSGKIVKMKIDDVVKGGHPYRGWGWHGNWNFGPHTHNFYYAGAESAHPHYKIYKCSCGAKEVHKNETFKDYNCPICYPNVSEGEYHIVSALDQSLGLNVAYNSTDATANVQLWDNMDEANQSSIVSVKRLDSGYYTLTFKNSGKNLDVYNANKTSGTNVWQYNPNGDDAQKWILAPTGDGYFNIITKLNTNLCLDVSGGNASAAANIQIYTKNNSKAQKWKFIASGVSSGQTIADGEYTIASAKNNYYGFNLYGGETTDGTNIHLWNNMGFNHPNSIVKVKYLGNGLYSIVFKKSDKALDVKGGSNANGTNVQQWSSNGSDAQKWIIKSAGNGSYYIISKGSGLALDADGGNMANGTNVQAYVLNYSAAQKWKFNRCRDKIVYNPNEGRLYNDTINAVYIDGINSGREESKIIVYTGVYGSKTTTNQYGDEFAFDSNGKKVGKRVYGNTEGLAIPSGGFVISKQAMNSYALHTVAGNAEYAYFDYNRGTVFFYNNEHDYLADTKTVAKGEAYGSLITPEREGCVFDGWYTSAEGGTKITEKSIYNGVDTLYANWSTIDGTNPDAEPVTEKTTDSPATEPVTDKPSETTDIQDPTDSTSEPSETIPQTPETTAVEPDETQNITDKPTEPDVTQPVTEKPTDEKQTIEPVADGYKRYMFLPSIDFENEGYNYRVMICDQNGEYKFYNLVATGIKFGEAMLYAADIPEETIPEIIQYMIFDGDDLISNVVEYASEKIKFDGKIVKFDGSIIDESDSDEPVPDKPIVKAKKTNPVKISVKAKTVKLKKLKKKAQNVKAITVSQAQGKVTYKLKSVPAKLKKFAKINSKGVITLKKWKKAKKGTYKITVQISVKGNSKYKPKTVNKTVKIKVK